jgi:hypothetical protein
VSHPTSRRISTNIIDQAKINKTKSLERTYLFWQNEHGRRNNKQDSKVSSNKISFTNNNTKSIYQS